MRHTLLLFLLWFPATCLHAQQKEFIVRNFTQEDGLPSNEAYYVFEDSKHFLWICTDNGVVRYNGNKFETFELPDNVVFRMKEDSKKRPWFFSNRGQLCYFEKGKINLHPYNQQVLNRIKKIHIKDALIQDDGTIELSSAADSNFIIHPNGGISAINTLSAQRTTLLSVNILNDNVCFTQILKELGGGDSLFIDVSGKRSRYYAIPFKHIASSQFGSISPDGKNIYLFYGSLLVKLRDDGSLITKEFPGGILSVKHNKEGLWVGLYKGGVRLLDDELSDTEENLILPGKSISSIAFDYEGGMWLSSLESGIYYIKDPSIKHVVINQQKEALVSRVYNVNDSLLIYTNTEGIHQLLNGKSDVIFKISNNNINSFFSNSKGILFCFGGFSDFYSRIVPINNAQFKYIYFGNIISSGITALQEENSWAASTTHEVVKYKSAFIGGRYDLHSDTFVPGTLKTLMLKPAMLFFDKNKIAWGCTKDGLYRSLAPYDTMLIFKPSSPLLSKGTNYIQQFDNGILTVAVIAGGIALIGKDSIILNLTEKEGLLSNKIRYLLSVKNQLWAATSKGISVINFTSFNPIQYSITNIDKSNGFYNFTINQLIKFREDIIAATSNGMYVIENPDDFLTKQSLPIPFYIQHINYYRGDTSEINSLVLPYSNNRASIRYKAISFNAFEFIQYQYRFTSGDTIWHTTTSNELVLENLEPGTYQLEIKAIMPAQHRASQMLQLSITVEKPWWQNNWIRLLVVLLVAAVVYWIVRSRIRKIKAEEKRKTELNSKLSELEQTALRSQMNPHFIFNCLTSIQQLIISGHKTDANEYLVKFSRLIRKTLEMSAQPFISISEEKEYLEEYLFLEQLRMTGRFDYTIVVDASINPGHVMIPNMMIQPVVENCVRHGIKSLENRKGIITVTFVPGSKTINCTIADNGVGRNNTSAFSEKAFTKHKSYGMDIVRKRLETFSEFNVDESGIEIKDLYDSDGKPAGTEVILYLPYKKTI